MSGQGEVTRLLEAAVGGDQDALDRLVPLVYDDLRRLAHRQLGREGGGHTLQTTGLVHEAYLKLAGGAGIGAANRAHFLAIAARAMRQVLVDYARRRKAEKRGGGVVCVTLNDGDQGMDVSSDDLLALDDILEPARSAPAAGGRAPFLRGSRGEGHRRGPGRFGAHGEAGLGEGPSLAVPRPVPAADHLTAPSAPTGPAGRVAAGRGDPSHFAYPSAPSSCRNVDSPSPRTTTE